MQVPAHSIVMFIRALHGGGAQQDAVALALGLAAAGWPVAVATLDASGPLRQRLGDALPLIDLGAGGKRRMAAALGPLRAMLATPQPAAIISSEAAANCLVTLAALGLGTRKRPAVLLREVAAPLRARRHDPFVQNRLGYRLAPLLYPRADRVLSFTEGVRRELVEHFAVRPERAVNLGTNAVMTEAQLGRLATDGPRLADQVVAVGRLSPEKDFATLIRAFVHVPAQLVILGEGPERAALEQLVARLSLGNRVRLAGFAADPLGEVQRSALLVSSSRHEGFGNAIVEALACGTPVVATDVPHGPSHILDRGRYGLLVPPGDPQALAAAIRHALGQPVDRALLRRRAADFTTERAVARFADELGALGLQPSLPQWKPR